MVKLLPRLCRYLMILLTVLISACGGGGGSGGGDPVPPAPIDTFETGRFIDAAVQGLNYKSPSTEGVTNANGEFTYKPGETITFSIGNIELGQITTDTDATHNRMVEGVFIATPMALFPEAQNSSDPFNYPPLVNLLRLLQSLDADNNPDNGIELSAQTRVITAQYRVVMNADMSVDGFSENSDLQALLTELKGTPVMVDAAAAVAHFKENYLAIMGEGRSVVGQISGMAADQSLVLSLNGSETLRVISNGRFQFNTALAATDTFAVTLISPPLGQTCTVDNAAGTADDLAQEVMITCEDLAPDAFTVGGKISGLNGSLQLTNVVTTAAVNNSQDMLNIDVNGNFSFSQTLATGDGFKVSLEHDDVFQTCAISGAEGVIETDNYTGINVVCTDKPTYEVTIKVEGLNGALGDILVVRQPAGAVLNFRNSGSKVFSNEYIEGSALTLELLDPQNHACQLDNPPDLITEDTTVTVTCQVDRAYAVSATVSGLTGKLSLKANGQTVSSVGNGKVQVLSGLLNNADFSVSVQQKPDDQRCTVNNGVGVINNANAEVTISCETIPSYSVSVAVTGLDSSTEDVLRVEATAGQTLTFTEASSKTFSSQYLENTPFSIKKNVLANHLCKFKGSVPEIITTKITINVECEADTSFKVNVTINGAESDIALTSNLGESFTFNAVNTSHTFGGYVFKGDYDLGALPSTSQKCEVTQGQLSGKTDGNQSVVITCDHLQKVKVNGLLGDLSVEVDGSQASLDFEAGSNNTLPLPTRVPHGQSTVLKIIQNDRQSCVFASGGVEKSVRSLRSETVEINCTTNKFEVAVSVSGHSGDVSVGGGALGDLAFAKSDTAAKVFSSLVSKGGAVSLTIDNKPDTQKCFFKAPHGGTQALVESVNEDLEIQIHCELAFYKVAFVVEGLDAGIAASGAVEIFNDQKSILKLTAQDNSGALFLDKDKNLTLSLDNRIPGYACHFIERDDSPLSEQGAEIPDFILQSDTGIKVSCVLESYALKALVNGTVKTFDMTLDVLSDATTETFTLNPDTTQNYEATITQLPHLTKFENVSITVQPARQLCAVDSAHTSGEMPIGGMQIKISCEPSNLIEDLAFNDAKLKSCVIAQAQQEGWTKIRDMSRLSCVNQGIVDLSGIERLTSLLDLNLANNDISNVAPLAQLASLNKLDITGTQIVDYSALEALTKLRSSKYEYGGYDEETANGQTMDLYCKPGIRVSNPLVELDSNETISIQKLFDDNIISPRHATTIYGTSGCYYYKDDDRYATLKMRVEVIGEGLYLKRFRRYDSGYERAQSFTVPINSDGMIDDTEILVSSRAATYLQTPRLRISLFYGHLQKPYQIMVKCGFLTEARES